MANNKIKSGLGRNSARHYEWRNNVKDRDGWKCQKCGSTEKVHAHHIIAWKENECQRFELNNGITLCKSCHKKEDGCVPAGWNKGLKRPKEWCYKLSKSLKGRIPWNKGLKGLKNTSETKFKKGFTPWNKGIKQIVEERICKKCGINKKIKYFTPLSGGKFYSHICKECRNKNLRIKNGSTNS